MADPRPGLPIPTETPELFELLRKHTFVLNYKGRHRVQSAYVLASNQHEANTKGQNYCTRFGLVFISSHPFYLDLDRQKSENDSPNIIG